MAKFCLGMTGPNFDRGQLD